MVTDMCNTTEGTLTLAQLLRDPLIRLVMDSDGVSMEELVEVLEVARAAVPVCASECAGFISLSPWAM